MALSNDQYRLLFDEAPDVRFVIQDGTVVACNRSAANLFKSTQKKLVGTEFVDLFAPDQSGHAQPTKVLEEKLLAAKTGLYQSFELVLQTTKGVAFPAKVQINYLPDEHSDIYQIILQSLAEEKRVQQLALQTRETLRLVLDNIPQYVFWKDAQYRYLGANRAFTQSLGFDHPAELIGNTDDELLINPEELAIYAQQDRRVLEGDAPIFHLIEPREQNGETFWIDTTKVPLHDANGNVVGLLGMVEDITERKRLEEALNRQLAQRGEQVRLSVEIAQEIAGSPGLDVLFSRVVTLVKERLGYYHVQIFRYDPQRDAVVLIAGYGKTGTDMLAEGHNLAMGRGVVGTAAATGRAVLAPNTAQDPAWLPNPRLPLTKGELAVPIKLGETVLGILDVQSAQADALTEDDQLLLEALSGQIALAIEDTRLRLETEESLQELRALQRVLSKQGWEEYRQIRRDTARGYQYDLQNLIPFETSSVNAYAQAGDDVSVVSTRMTVRGETIGVLGLEDDPSKPLTREERVLLEEITAQVSEALEKARLLESNQRQSSNLATLNEMGRELTGLQTVDAVIQTVFEYTSRLMDTTNFYVALYDDESKLVSFPFVIDDKQLIPVVARPIGNGLTDYVIKQKEALLLSANPEETMKELGIDLIIVGISTESWLGVPLMIGRKVVGVLGVQSEIPRTFTEYHRDLLMSIGGQTAIAVQNAQLFQEIEERLEETGALYQASAALNANASYEAILDIIRRYTILGDAKAHNVTLNLFDRPWKEQDAPEWLIPIAHWHKNPQETTAQERYPIEDWAITNHLLRYDTSVFIADVMTDERLDETARKVYGETLGAKSVFLSPMIVGGDWLGHLIAYFEDDITMDEDELRRINAITQQASITLQNIRLLEETRRRATQLQTAAEIARESSGSLELGTLLGSSVNLIQGGFDFYYVGVFLVEENQFDVAVRAATGDAGAEMMRQGYKLPINSQSVVGKVVESGAFVVVNDTTKSDVYHAHPLLPDTRAELALPMKIGRRIIGALDVQSTQVDVFRPDDVAVLQTLADQIAVAVDNARSYELAQTSFQESRKRVEELSTLFQVGQSLSSATLETQEIARIIAESFNNIIPVSSDTALSFLTEDSYLRVLASIEQRDGTTTLVEDPSVHDYALDQFPATRKVIEEIEPGLFFIDDPDIDPNELSYMRSERLTTMIVLPLASKGQGFGVIEIEIADEKYRVESETMTLLMTLANQAAAALENAILYEEQQKTAEELRELDTLKNQFLANMSHELRTPLNSIIGFSRVILRGIDGPITDLQEQDLTAIYNSGQHLLGLINDILDLSRIEAGKMELHFDEVNIESVITSVLSTGKGLVKEKPVDLRSNIEHDLPVVWGDQTRLRQILLNLIQNAAKFTEEGHINVEAKLQTRSEGTREIYISVTDTGVGIAQEDQRKLFEPFSQVDSSATRKTEGTGLGLSITRNLVELHGGKIDVYSEVNKGSTFFFTIPVREEETPEINPEPGDRVILAIDDDPQLIQLYDRYLTNEGYTVAGLTEPRKAVFEARKIRPFAILLDVMMPEKSGWDVIRDLKKSPDTASIPVLFCTIIDNRAMGYSLGAVDYLLKPILEDDLVSALNRIDSTDSQFRVLVIDDDPDDLRLLARILESSGVYQVNLVQGGKKGLEAIKEQKPDVVILDLSMPDMSGFELLDIIKEQEDLENIPVVVLTAKELSESEYQRLRNQTEDVLRKGVFDDEGLLASLQISLNALKETNL